MTNRFWLNAVYIAIEVLAAAALAGAAVLAIWASCAWIRERISNPAYRPDPPAANCHTFRARGAVPTHGMAAHCVCCGLTRANHPGPRPGPRPRVIVPVQRVTDDSDFYPRRRTTATRRSHATP